MIRTIFAAAGLSLVLISAAHALVAQKPSQALSLDIRARDGEKKPAAPSESAAAAIFHSEGKTDYGAISGKLLPDIPQQKLYIDFKKLTARTVISAPNQIFYVILPLSENLKWKNDTEASTLVSAALVSTDDDSEVWEITALKSGDATLYWDAFDDNTVVASRILRLRIR